MKFTVSLRRLRNNLHHMGSIPAPIMWAVAKHPPDAVPFQDIANVASHHEALEALMGVNDDPDPKQALVSLGLASLRRLSPQSAIAKYVEDWLENPVAVPQRPNTDCTQEMGLCVVFLSGVDRQEMVGDASGWLYEAVIGQIRSLIAFRIGRVLACEVRAAGTREEMLAVIEQQQADLRRLFCGV